MPACCPTRNVVLKHLVPSLGLVVFVALAGCGDRKPASSYALNDPPASYPATSPEASSGGPKTSSGPNTKSSRTTSGSGSETVIWEHLGQWSGNNSVQTESFTGETGALRITWEANAAKDSKDPSFLLVIHSAISGRPLQTAVDLKGSGASVAYVNEDPRVFFAVVEAKDTDWKFSIDEAIGTRVIK